MTARQNKEVPWRVSLETIEEINRADQELDLILESLSRTAGKRHRRRATASVVTNRGRLILGTPGDERDTSRLTEGPTLVEIVSALSRMQQAYEMAETAWAEVTPALRPWLEPPPTRFADGVSL